MKKLVACLIMAAVLALGGAMGHLQQQPAPHLVSAQEECENNDCAIVCNESGDAWFGDRAQWLIVHAMPRLEGTSTNIRWTAATSNDWPILTVLAQWEVDSYYHSATMTIDEDGNCVHTDNPDRLIRCHKPSGQTPPDLCDGYGGDWERIGTGNCLSEVIYGFDFKQTFEYGGRTYCWNSVVLIPGDNTGLYGKSASNCSGSPLDWSDVNDGYGWYCQTVDERPGGATANERWVFYIYD